LGSEPAVQNWQPSVGSGVGRAERGNILNPRLGASRARTWWNNSKRPVAAPQNVAEPEQSVLAEGRQIVERGTRVLSVFVGFYRTFAEWA